MGIPGHGFQLLEPVGSQHQPLEPGGALVSSHWGMNIVCLENQLLRGPGQVRKIRGTVPTAGVGLWVTAHVPGCGWWQGVRVSLSSPNPLCMGCACVFTSKYGFQDWACDTRKTELGLVITLFISYIISAAHCTFWLWESNCRKNSHYFAGIVMRRYSDMPCYCLFFDYACRLSTINKIKNFQHVMGHFTF